MHVGLEGNDLGVVRQHGERFEFLVGLHSLDVQVHAVAPQTHSSNDRGGLVTLGMELEPDLDMGSDIPPDRVHMGARKDQFGPSFQQPALAGVEDVGVSPYFVRGKTTADTIWRSV